MYKFSVVLTAIAAIVVLSIPANSIAVEVDLTSTNAVESSISSMVENYPNETRAMVRDYLVEWLELSEEERIEELNSAIEYANVFKENVKNGFYDYECLMFAESYLHNLSRLKSNLTDEYYFSLLGEYKRQLKYLTRRASTQEESSIPATLTEEVTLFEDDFEANNMDEWYITDRNSDGTQCYWDRVDDGDYINPYSDPCQGNYQLYCGGYNTNWHGWVPPYTPNYHDDMDAIARFTFYIGRSYDNINFYYSFRVPTLDDAWLDWDDYYAIEITDPSGQTTEWERYDDIYPSCMNVFLGLESIIHSQGYWRIAFLFHSDWFNTEVGQYIDDVSLVGEYPTDIVNEDRDNPNHYVMSQNFPNPFNDRTIISFTLPEAAHVTVRAYDLMGNFIETLLHEEKEPGVHQITWNASDLPTGVYFYKIQAGEFIETKKMLLLK